jgi:hypothetical protein
LHGQLGPLTASWRTMAYGMFFGFSIISLVRINCRTNTGRLTSYLSILLVSCKLSSRSSRNRCFSSNHAIRLAIPVCVEPAKRVLCSFLFGGILATMPGGLPDLDASNPEAPTPLLGMLWTGTLDIKSCTPSILLQSLLEELPIAERLGPVLDLIVSLSTG